MEKGQVLEIKIEDITGEGMGVGKVDGMAVFVEGVVLGDVVKAELMQVKKRYANARAKQILAPSDERCEPICKSNCGGCALRETRYQTQLKIKEKQIKDKLERIAGVESPNVLPIIGMENPFNYRNKAQFQAGEKNGKPIVGFYKKKTHDIDECNDCAIQALPAMTAANVLQSFMQRENIKPYDRKSGKGLIRNLIVRTAVNTGEVMIIIVATNKAVPKLEELIKELDDAIYNIPQQNGMNYSLESIIININRRSTSEILGEQCITVAGKSSILEKTCGLNFEISPLAFYQVNPAQVEKLYAKVIEFADLKGDETVLDLYCGVGTIGLLCAKKMVERTQEKYKTLDYKKLGTVYGIESVKGAVLNANRNAVINGIVNARFICGKAEEKLEGLLAGKIDESEQEYNEISPDIVILDPPRAGCEPELLSAVASAMPSKIIYVSCDPGTMARDIKILSESGYKLEDAQPIDMFPWTGSTEMVALITRV
ncbi:MAG: 23S rRNA (uracil(1939)-C(5))-methyltransferase RlmD [Eubacteriales bacterium]|nr:23S rRNA (uracil(1939)-C(5))-methyltransferase RlmD [Eubacteriales bacterium]MDD4390548.1 23S rRNA (uracil(1939)-C(5))-methyltransferase RlmD [Eubacteriales bacterium]